jgi:hypothetical protein
MGKHNGRKKQTSRQWKESVIGVRIAVKKVRLLPIDTRGPALAIVIRQKVYLCSSVLYMVAQFLQLCAM